MATIVFYLFFFAQIFFNKLLIYKEGHNNIYFASRLQNEYNNN